MSECYGGMPAALHVKTIQADRKATEGTGVTAVLHDKSGCAMMGMHTGVLTTG